MRLFIALFFLISFCGCGPDKTDTLYIATAANVQFAMEELTAEFTEFTGIQCEIIIGSSGKLMAQIREGAPFHVFVSADMKYPQTLFEDNRTTGPPIIYAKGGLVLWSLDSAVSLSIKDLEQPGIKKIAMANPLTAPYGRAAMQSMNYFRTYEKVSEKLVYGESISQTNQFILSETAQIGFTARSVVLAPKMKNTGFWQDVDPISYSPIDQGIVIINSDEEHIKSAETFLKFLMSPESQEILKRFGYITDDIK